MLEIKENLDNKICDIVEDAFNQQTFREFFVEGWKEVKSPLSVVEEASLDEMSNEELNEMLDELDWLLSK